MNLLQFLRDRLEQALTGLAAEPARYVDLVRPSQDAKFGHYQINAAMPLGKELQRNPREVAAELVAQLQVADLCEPPEIAGPGFVNLRLRTDWLAVHTRRLVGDERLGVASAEKPRTYVIDYSSPNVAKPMHVGHLRSTVIGDCLCRVLRCMGHTVVSDNHLGDWGTQFGMILAGYKRFLDRAAYERCAVAELARLYRLVNQVAGYWENKQELAALEADMERRAREPAGGQRAGEKASKRAGDAEAKARERMAELRRSIAAVEDDAALVALAREHRDLGDVARQETVKLHHGDAENRRLWQMFLPPCRAAIDAIYERLGVRFDHTLGESFYDPMLPAVAGELESQGIAHLSEGALCVTVDAKLPPCIVRKTDGAFTYATTDLATIKHRMETFHPHAILYVVGQPQALHFQQIFGAAALWGYRNVELAHVAFGSVLGDDGRPFRTRAGDTVGLESLLDEAVERALAQYEASRAARQERGEEVPQLDEAHRRRIAEAVGIGAIKYADLSQNRTSDYVFNWDKMLAMEGNTATYMQYAYARIRSIFRKGGVDAERVRAELGELRLDHPAEQDLALEVSRLPEMLDAVGTEYRPNILTAWLYTLAGRFSTFYNQCPVLKADDDALRGSRLALCDLTARAIERGVGLLGIEVVEQM